MTFEKNIETNHVNSIYSVKDVPTANGTVLLQQIYDRLTRCITARIVERSDSTIRFRIDIGTASK